MKNTLFCVVDDRAEAERIVRELVGAGISRAGITIIAPDGHGDRHLPHDGARQTALRAMPSAVTNGLIGAVLGAYLALATMAIPGPGLLNGLGPVETILACAAGGAAVGWITSLTMKQAMPVTGAKAYEHAVRDGKILVQVQAEDDHQRAVAAGIVSSGHGTIINQSSDYTW
jgi:hypothetical protein